MRSSKRALAAIALLSSVATAQQYVISTYAGGTPPPTPVLAADLPAGSVSGIAADAAGNVFFTRPSELNCVFKLDLSGVITRVAGNSTPGYSGDGGPATSAQLNGPNALAVDGAGNLFIVDAWNSRIRKVSASGIITTVAGDGKYGRSADGEAAVNAHLAFTGFSFGGKNQSGVAVDGAGNLFFAEPGFHRVRRVSTNGIVTTVAGNEILGFPVDGAPATTAHLNTPLGVAVDRAGNLFIADTFNRRVQKVSPGGIITTVAEDVSAVSVAIDGADNLFVADISFGRVLRASPGGPLTVVAGNGSRGFSGDGGPATSAALEFPTGVAVDRAGNVFIADAGNNRIRKVSTSGIITTVTGNSTTCCYSGDGGAAVSAELSAPSGLATDSEGNLFIATGTRVRKVGPGGIITSVAGNGTVGSSGDGGPASAALIQPTSVAVDGAGNLFIGENVRIRKVSSGGIITTVAGNGTAGFSGDGGPATSAALNYVWCLAVDGAGNLFIGDSGNFRVRKVSPDGIITTVAGNGISGFSGDGGPATRAGLGSVASLAVDGAGNLFIVDGYSVRKVSPNGIITTVAGRRMQGFSGDGGPATGAALSWPTGVAVDRAGNLFIADAFSIRMVSTDGTITTIGGNGCCYWGDVGGPASPVQLSRLTAVAVDKAGNVFVAESGDDGDYTVAPAAVRVLRPTNSSVLVRAVVDAASARAGPASPGKIVVIYGAGLGPAQLVQNRPADGQFGTEVGGTTVSFNGMAAPILYASATQVSAIVPYLIGGSTAEVTVAYQGQTSAAFAVPVALSAPGIFTSNQTGAGQAAAFNADGTVNSAANPVKLGGYISLYATGEGQAAAGGVDGKLSGSRPSPPILPVNVLVDGIRAVVQYAGGAPGQVAGLMQVNVQIPHGVKPGGYVPVALQVGHASTTPGAVWIAVSGN